MLRKVPQGSEVDLDAFDNVYHEERVTEATQKIRVIVERTIAKDVFRLEAMVGSRVGLEREPRRLNSGCHELVKFLGRRGDWRL